MPTEAKNPPEKHERLDDPLDPSHGYFLTDVAVKLGYSRWQDADKLIRVLEAQTGYDMKSEFSIYHISGGTRSRPIHWYSDEAIDLLRQVRDGKKYVISKKVPRQALAYRVRA